MALHIRGVVLPDDEARDLWIDGDRVSATPVPGAVTVVDRGFILPGLVDAHCHIGIAPGGKPIERIEQARELALIDRGAGVLAIRDAGSPFPYPQLDEDPHIPRLARAGRHVAPPRRYLPEIGVEVPAELVAAEVTRQAAAGTGWVKLVGDWIDRDRGDLAPAWDDATLTAAVEAAHAAGARITAHCFEEQSVATLVRAGIDCVEHGTGLATDIVAEMARQGTALVPTMINIETFGTIASRAEAKFPLYAKHMRALKDGFPGIVRSAYEAGVPIYVGSDAGGGIGHGLAAQEMLRLHAAGIPALQVLAAGSWGARDWLGFGPDLADITVYAKDPRRDLRILLDPQVIVLKGRLVKGPGGTSSR
jgi:imidazolonepropionase-like amidohydrolase